MKTFLVDVDGVVADLISEWLLVYNLEYKDVLKPSSITSWGIHEYVKPECGEKIYDYLWDETLYNNVKPIDGALSSINWFRELGHRVIFVTSGVQPAKIEWLSRHGFLRGQYWQSDKDVVIASDKSLIKGDFLIDDNVKNCESFCGSGNSILFNQPWNSGEWPYARVNSWANLVHYLSKRIDD